MKKYILTAIVCMLAVVAYGKKTIDPQYGIGAVPVDANGKVTFTQEIPVPSGMTDDQAYDAMLAWAKGYFSLGTSQKAKILSENSESRSFTLTAERMLIFKRTAFMSDETVIGYSFSCAVRNGVCTTKITDIRYRYEEKRESGGSAFTAEEWITDDEAFNRKKTKFFKMTGKFRIKTIDMVHQIGEKIQEALN